MEREKSAVGTVLDVTEPRRDSLQATRIAYGKPERTPSIYSLQVRPEKSGQEPAKALLAAKPGLRTLFIFGYPQPARLGGLGLPAKALYPQWASGCGPGPMRPYRRPHRLSD